jgi:hypothetical protein
MADISKTEILKVVRRALNPEKVEQSLIYWYKTVIQKDQPIKVGTLSIAMPFDGTIVFVDLAPRANWAHPCLYLLVDTKTLETKILEASLPPDIDQFDESYIILLRYGEIPPHERYFNAFDK